MAAGRLGTPANLTAATNTTLYTNATTYAVCTVNILNRNTTALTIRLGLTSTGTSGGFTGGGGTPGLAEWLEFDTVIPANGVLERTGLVVGATQNLVAYASATGVTAMVYGIET
jgi:hypothetical protein